MNPTIQALKQLGGSGTIDEITNKVTEIMNLTDKQLEVPHGDRGRISEIEYRLGWSRSYLKKYGVLENSVRGIWAITSEGNKIDSVDPNEVRRYYLTQIQKMKVEEEVEDED